MFRLMLTIGLLFSLSCPPVIAYEDKTERFALVIGNQNYAKSPLKNAINDAQAMSASLTELGFRVNTLIDSQAVDLKNSVQKFYADIQRVKSGQALALFYYAGHAIQIEHRNYLVPLNMQFSSRENFRASLFDLNSLFVEIAKLADTQNIVILDACRNNPFGEMAAGEDNTISAGLAPLKAPSGTLIAYATEPGGVASDGRAKNGIYTKYLLRHIGKEISVEEVFKKVRKGVATETRHQQIPWEHSSLLHEVFINPPRNRQVPDIIVF